MTVSIRSVRDDGRETFRRVTFTLKAEFEGHFQAGGCPVEEVACGFLSEHRVGGPQLIDALATFARQILDRH